jgi:hypothetical protein
MDQMPDRQRGQARRALPEMQSERQTNSDLDRMKNDEGATAAEVAPSFRSGERRSNHTPPEL